MRLLPHFSALGFQEIEDSVWECGSKSKGSNVFGALRLEQFSDQQVSL